MSHPLYKNDSKISSCLNCCLINQIINLNKEQNNICGCAMTESDSHDSLKNDTIIDILKVKKAGSAKKMNVLFEGSDNESLNSETNDLNELN